MITKNSWNDQKKKTPTNRKYERQLALACLQEIIRKERSKFIDQYGFLTDNEKQALKNTIEYC